MKKSKTPPTEEQIQDSIKLRELFSQRAGVSQLEFGQVYGIGNQGMVWQYLNADKPKGSVLNVFAALKFAEGLHCRVSDFSPSLQLEIDRIASFASKTGDGQMNPNIPTKEVLAERRAKGIAHQKKIDPDGQIQAGTDAINNFLAAAPETQEVINYFLLEEGKEKPGWADSDARAYAEALQYKAHKWITGGEKKTG